MLPDEDAWWSMQELNARYADAGMEFAEQMGRENPSAWKSVEVRAALKGHLASEIAHDTRLSAETVSEFISSWASSSSDINVYSLAMQIAAAELFDLSTTPFIEDAWKEVGGVLESVPYEVTSPAMTERLPAARQIVRAVYERTQSWLRVRGIEKVTLGRGQSWSHQKVPGELAAGSQEMIGEDRWLGEANFEQNPLSSWSIDPNTARQFSTTRPKDSYYEELHIAVTMWAEVPAERIISTPFTGPGCLTESEFLVAGGKMPVHFRGAAISSRRGVGSEVRLDRIRHHLNPWWQLGREQEESGQHPS